MRNEELQPRKVKCTWFEWRKNRYMPSFDFGRSAGLKRLTRREFSMSLNKKFGINNGNEQFNYFPRLPRRAVCKAILLNLNRLPASSEVAIKRLIIRTSSAVWNNDSSKLGSLNSVCSRFSTTDPTTGAFAKRRRCQLAGSVVVINKFMEVCVSDENKTCRMGMAAAANNNKLAMGGFGGWKRRVIAQGR